MLTKNPLVIAALPVEWYEAAVRAKGAEVAATRVAEAGQVALATAIRAAPRPELFLN